MGEREKGGREKVVTEMKGGRGRRKREDGID